MKRWLFLLLIITNLNVWANPSPLGLELNKATILDVEKIYKITKKEKNYWAGYNYYIDIKDIKLEGIRELLVISNDNYIIQAIILTLSNNKFGEFYELLVEKYKPINKYLPNLSNKEIQFIDNDCTIILDAPSNSFNMSLIYITNDFLTRFKDKQKEERLLIKIKEKELL